MDNLTGNAGWGPVQALWDLDRGVRAGGDAPPSRRDSLSQRRDRIRRDIYCARFATVSALAGFAGLENQRRDRFSQRRDRGDCGLSGQPRATCLAK